MFISVSRIFKRFAEKAVLKDVSFQLNLGDKVGLIGPNGTGKSTLLRIMSGVEDVDSGAVTRQSSLRIGCLEQVTTWPQDQEQSLLENALSIFEDMEALATEIDQLESEIEKKSQDPEVASLLSRYGHLQTRWEVLGGYSYKARAKAVLSGLGFSETDFFKRTSVLSGGELNRLSLAKLLLSDSNLLLLDEPTNHLDLSAARWLQEFLIYAPQTFVLISHDRCLLDATVERVFELSDGSLEEYRGNYSSYVSEREVRRSLGKKAYDQQQKVIAKTEEFIQRNIAGQKTRQAKSRRKSLEKLERLKAAPDPRSGAAFRFNTNSQSGEVVLQLCNLEIGYPEHMLARNINLTIHRGENTGIVGPNGSGKSTLLKTMLSLESPLSGEVHIGRKVETGFYDQQLASLNVNFTVLDSIRQVAPLAQDEILRKFLAKFLFTGSDVLRPCQSLSGGEKSRLVLARLIFGGANTLFLDEPTNHLDIPSREALESALSSFPGTLVIVSHDRYLLNKLVDQVVFLDGNGNAILFDGPYEEFERNQAEASATVWEDSTTQFAKQSIRPSELCRRDMSKNERSKLKQRCLFLEEEIGRVEKHIELLTAELSSPELGKDFHKLNDITCQQKNLNSRLDQLYKEWEFALGRLEEPPVKPHSKHD